VSESILKVLGHTGLGGKKTEIQPRGPCLGLALSGVDMNPHTTPKQLMNRGKLVGVPLMGARDYSLHYSFVLAFHDFAISFAFIFCRALDNMRRATVGGGVCRAVHPAARKCPVWSGSLGFGCV
jgi:hypothetical protein